MNILIVDDEAMIREWMAYTIGNLPLDINTLDSAVDGFEALEKLQLQAFDLVFVDITMPKMNGIELIKQMNTLPELPMIIVLSSHDHFDYAREAFQYNAKEYVLKSECNKEKLFALIQECQQAMTKKEMSIDLGYYRSAFLTAIMTDTEPDSKLSLDDLFPELLETPFIVIAYNRHASPSLKPNDLFQYNHHIFIGNNKFLTFFAYITKKGLTPQYLKTMVNQYAKENNIQVGCSPEHSSIHDLPKAIKMAYKAKQQLFYSSEKCMIANANHLHKTEMTEIYEQCHRILNNIKSNALDEARDNLSILHHIITLHKPEDVDYIKNINYNILSALLVHLAKNTEQVMPDLDTLKLRMEESQCFSEIKSYTDEYFYFLDPLQRSITKISSQYILEAINYIHTRYATIESIAQIANYVHINTDYFSRLFKKEVGVPASTYLMNYKLEMSAKLLSTTSDTVYEIALQVGYSNISYFSKIFKAKYNLQPSHYRREHK